MNSNQHYQTMLVAPFGILGIQIAADTLIAIDLLDRPSKKIPTHDPIAKEVCQQLKAYFADPSVHFDVPIRLDGTSYQKKVWHALTKIPVGKPLSYGALAQRLQSGARAIGGACRANPIPIVVPCHRVVAKSGVGGYMGYSLGRGVDMKRWLLRHEGYNL